MKGLIVKDIMCLKKQLTMFVYVLIGVVIISIMYVLSARYGNIALAGREMLSENDMSEIDVKNLGTMALVLFMLLPIATVGDMANVFTEDGKAGFYKLSGTFPVSIGKRLLSRYITIYALLGIGMLIDIMLAFLLSVITELISFRDFLGIIVSAASVMSIYSALVILFCILLGYGKETYAQLLSIGSMIFGFLFISFKTIKESFILSATGEDNIDFLWNALDFIKEKSHILFITAALVSIFSFLLSYVTAQRKRGVI